MSITDKKVTFVLTEEYNLIQRHKTRYETYDDTPPLRGYRLANIKIPTCIYVKVNLDEIS